jgi:hypothetical protein
MLVHSSSPQAQTLRVRYADNAFMKRIHATLLALFWCAVPDSSFAQADEKPVYRCPGSPVLYTDALTAKEARTRGCRNIEGTPITVIPATRVKVAPKSTASSRRDKAKIGPAEQRARDKDARNILESELRNEEELLAVLRSEYNGGEPERRGDERNFQKYLDRAAALKVRIERKDSDIAAIKRELIKLRR